MNPALVIAMYLRAAAPQAEDVIYQRASVVGLIGSPDRYRNKDVQVIGFVACEFEGTALYLSEEAYRYHITKNAVWLELSPDLCSRLGVNKKHALVEGRFDPAENGHGGLFSGTLTVTGRAVVWSESEKREVH